jgi:hypothetical protein
MIKQLGNSVQAGKSVRIVAQSELSEIPEQGVFIGKSLVYNIPVFIDTDQLINPHIAVLGMTGSGKSYFLKNYLFRSAFGEGAGVFIVDWNGEYDELVRGADGRVVSPEGSSHIDFPGMFSGLNSVSLASLQTDAEKRSAAKNVLGLLADFMRQTGIGTKERRVVVLDEAWRLLDDGKILGQLFREGRKYGFSVVIASQMAKDISNEIVSNVACLLIFKLQNTDDFTVLVDSGIISDRDRRRIFGFGLGQCLIHTIRKTGRQGSIHMPIRKIDGFEMRFYSLSGGKMKISVTGARFADTAREVFGNGEIESALANLIESNRRDADIVGIIKLLIKKGAGRPDIVTFLRKLGFDDSTIVDSYASARQAKNGT